MRRYEITFSAKKEIEVFDSVTAERVESLHRRWIKELEVDSFDIEVKEIT